MKYIWIALILFASSCSDGKNFNRGYVISKSHFDSEKEEVSAEEPDVN